MKAYDNTYIILHANCITPLWLLFLYFMVVSTDPLYRPATEFLS